MSCTIHFTGNHYHGHNLFDKNINQFITDTFSKHKCQMLVIITQSIDTHCSALYTEHSEISVIESYKLCMFYSVEIKSAIQPKPI